MDKVWEWYAALQPEIAKDCFKTDMTAEEFVKFYMG